MKRLDPNSQLAARIRKLPSRERAEVEDFVALLAHRRTDRDLLKAAARLTSTALKRIWNNDEDAAYDPLVPREGCSIAAW
jgi:hypothetical protein